METSKQKTLAIFDFDGTLTTRDTFIDLIIFSKGIFSLLAGILINFRILLLYLLGMTSGDNAKEQLFAFFFKNLKSDQFLNICQKYAQNRIPKILNQRVLNKFFWHKARGDITVIVTASIKQWVEPLAFELGFKRVIATEIEILNQKLTGKFSTPNCNGPEKVKRFVYSFPNHPTYLLYVYGNLKGDKELMQLAGHSEII